MSENERAILRVLDALRSGWDTSRDIAEETGIPPAEVSVWLGELRKMGLAKITYRSWGTWSERGGRKFHKWAAT